MSLCVAELNRAGLEPGDTEQVIHHLHRELLEAQELANTGKQRCLELQGKLSGLFIYFVWFAPEKGACWDKILRGGYNWSLLINQ